MPHVRSDASALYLGDDQFIVIGGAVLSEPLIFVEMLHRREGAWTWRTLASMIHARSEAAVMSLNDGSHILAVGGRRGDEACTSEMFRFPLDDADMGQWSLVELQTVYDGRLSVFSINAGVYKFSKYVFVT